MIDAFGNRVREDRLVSDSRQRLREPFEQGGVRAGRAGAAMSAAVAPRGPRWREAAVLVATLVGVAVTARLGLWQLDRAGQKAALQAALDARAGEPELLPSALASSAEEAARQHYRRVRLRGEWVPGRTVFLENRQMKGQPGFFVVTPLRLPGDAGAVLVQRANSLRSLSRPSC